MQHSMQLAATVASLCLHYTYLSYITDCHFVYILLPQRCCYSSSTLPSQLLLIVHNSMTIPTSQYFNIGIDQRQRTRIAQFTHSGIKLRLSRAISTHNQHVVESVLVVRRGYDTVQRGGILGGRGRLPLVALRGGARLRLFLFFSVRVLAGSRGVGKTDDSLNKRNVTSTGKLYCIVL